METVSGVKARKEEGTRAGEMEQITKLDLRGQNLLISRKVSSIPDKDEQEFR